MAPTYFPLRWESTGDQWWYASPINYAAANGHYDLVRELLRMDNNHLFKLTSLRRIRRLESVWDDEEQFTDVSKCRSQVAQKLFQECESSKKGKNSLIKAGYGGWLIYTAASAGDLGFVRLLLEKNPLLVFGEGEYGVTDILYAAAKGKNSLVFNLIYDFAISPRFQPVKGEAFEEHLGEIPAVYRSEILNRALHAAARGGNLMILQDLLSKCTDVLAYRDKHGCTILHAAAGKGQVEIVRFLMASFDVASATDNQGNTALHTAAYRGQGGVVSALVSVSVSLISVRNNAGETFLHTAVSGFQNPAFRRVDCQVQLMKQLVCKKGFKLDHIINAKNNDGRTALHMAIFGNLQADLVELLMSARGIDVNVRDKNGMTPLDLLRQHPRSASSDLLIRQLISAGGMFGSQEHIARRAFASHLKMLGNGVSPGTCFRIPDTEIYLYTGIDTPTEEIRVLSADKKPDSTDKTLHRLKSTFLRTKKVQKQGNEGHHNKGKSFNGAPTPLRERFSKPASPSSNKRALSVRSNQCSPVARKKVASGLMHGVLQAMPHLSSSRHSRSSSFSKLSFCSPSSLEIQKDIFMESGLAEPSCSSERQENGKTGFRKSFRSQFCFGGPSLAASRHRRSQSAAPPSIALMA